MYKKIVFRKQKGPIGFRLALLARKYVYREDIPADAPAARAAYLTGDGAMVVLAPPISLGLLTERISREFGRKAPGILIVAPAPVGEQVEECEFTGIYDRTSVEKSRKLPALYQAMANRHGWGFLNAGDVVGTLGKDCVHLTPLGHEKLSRAIYEKIKEMAGGSI